MENIRNELRRLYRAAVGKDPDPEVVLAEAQDFVAQHGPNADLKKLFE
ncbi:MAG: hypothetical protein ACLPT6_00670 [Desulfobaccales bacterium]